MEHLGENDFDILTACPWDGADVWQSEFLYTDDMGCDVVRCSSCGAVYARRRLNQNGRSKYWEDYLSRVHAYDKDDVAKRRKMYNIDYAFSQLYVSKGTVLDVGCSDGAFLSLYEKNGYGTCGVEYGKEAAEEAAKSHNVRYGSFPDLDFGENRFDLIIFRGVLQYVPQPKVYLKKAAELLTDKLSSPAGGGHLFITAQPNVESMGFQLFGKNFTQPVTGADFMGFSERLLTSFLSELGLRKVGERYFYTETPYADVENDVLCMEEAIRKKQCGEKIDFSAPPFWGNMMSLIYTKAT